MKLYISFMLMLLLAACGSNKQTENSSALVDTPTPVETPNDKSKPGSEKEIDKDINLGMKDFKNTQWTCAPMNDLPGCIDSLIFGDSTGFAYSCEQETSLEFHYQVSNDTLRLNIYDYASHTSDDVILSEKQSYIITKDGLRFARFQVNRGDYWDDVDMTTLGALSYQVVNSDY